MKILIINASPRLNGNSSFISEALAEKYGDESEVINLSQLDIKPCTACRACKVNNSLCVINDDI